MIVQYGTDHRDADNLAGLARLVRACCLLDAVSALVGCMIAIPLIMLCGPLFGLAPDIRWNALLFAVALILSIRSTPLGILRLHGRWAAATGAELILPIMRLAGAIAAAIAEKGVVGFLAAWAAAELITAASYWLLAARTGEIRTALRTKITWTTFRPDNPGFWRFALISNAGATLALIGRQISILMAGGLSGAAAAGGFRLAFQVAQALTRFAQILARATFPELVNMRAAGSDGASLSTLLRRLDRIAIGVALIVLFLLVIAGKPLLLLIAGPAYASSYPLLILLGIAGSIDLASASYEPALTAAGHAGRAFIIRLTATALFLALQVLLVPLYGLTGVGIAMLTGSALTAALLGLATRRSRQTGVDRRSPFRLCGTPRLKG